MKLYGAPLVLFVTSFLCGCGGGLQTVEKAPSLTKAPTSTEQQLPNIAGNWQFTATSTLPGKSSPTLAGSISQNSDAIGGALHVQGSDCFDPLATMYFTGATLHGNTLLTSNTVDGQVITISGKFTQSAFSGTYKATGGCVADEQGSLVGFNIPYLANELSGTFVNSAHDAFNVAGEITQSVDPRADGTYEISGSATFDTPCFHEGTIKHRPFPFGSYVLGASVSFEFQTINGILKFLGAFNKDKSAIEGNYGISGDTCHDTGTAVLHLSSPWDY